MTSTAVLVLGKLFTTRVSQSTRSRPHNSIVVTDAKRVGDYRLHSPAHNNETADFEISLRYHPNDLDLIVLNQYD